MVTIDLQNTQRIKFILPGGREVIGDFFATSIRTSIKLPTPATAYRDGGLVFARPGEIGSADIDVSFRSNGKFTVCHDGAVEQYVG